MIYFINENPNPMKIGGLGVYKSKDDLISQLESCYADTGHIIFNVEGDCFKLVVNGEALSLKKLKSTIRKDVIFDCLDYLLAGSRPHHQLEDIEMAEDHKDYKIAV